jgi:hypothetical protein
VGSGTLERKRQGEKVERGKRRRREARELKYKLNKIGEKGFSQVT